MTAIRERVQRHRALIGRFLFEFVIIVVGVTVAFGIEAARQRASDTAYRESMIAALMPTLDNMIVHNEAFEREVGTKLKAFDAAIARGEQPVLPVFREGNSERPPVRGWDGIVATGAARSLDPAMFFKLSLFYTRQESFGERYLRYNDFTEQRVLTLGRDQRAAYDAAGLKPDYAAWVDRLRDLRALNQGMTDEARTIKAALSR